MCKKERKRSDLRGKVVHTVSKYQGQLTISNLTVEEASLEQRKAIRKEFNNGGKRDFYRYLAQAKPHILTRLGLVSQSIEIMAEHGLEHGKGILLPQKFQFFTVDHIRSIRWGGGNNIDNLCLVPAKANILKGQFEDSQARGKTGSFSIKTITPTTKPSGNYLRYVIEQTANRDRRKARDRTHSVYRPRGAFAKI